jgi:hypothetical protein
MPRFANRFFGGYPTSPVGAQIGADLGTALFGNPAMALDQMQGQARIGAFEAQAAADAARGGLYGEQTRGERIGNDALVGLPGLIAGLVAPPQMEGEAGAAPPMETFDPNRLAAVAAAALQGNRGGNLGELMRTLGAFAGGDGLARRGMVAGGQTPGENFAITPERADEIRRQGFSADLAKSLGVANIGAAADRYGADVKAGADVKVAGIKDAGDTIRAASAPRAVDGAITYDNGKTWVRPPPGYTPPVVTRSVTTRDAEGRETGKTERKYQAAPDVSPPKRRQKYNPATGKIE